MHREQWASKAKNRIYLTATKRNDKRRGRCRKLVQGGGHEGWYSWPAENGEYWLRGSPGGILVVEGICSVNVGLNGGGLSWGVEERRHRPRVVFVLALGIARSGCVCRACVPRLRSCTHAHFCVIYSARLPSRYTHWRFARGVPGDWRTKEKGIGLWKLRK